MRVVRPRVPLETQGRINRMQSDMETEQNNMAVRNDIEKGRYFVLHDICYQALRAIPKGAEAKPGSNCIAVDINDILGGN